MWIEVVIENCAQNLWTKVLKKVVNISCEEELWTKVFKISHEQDLWTRLVNMSCEQELWTKVLNIEKNVNNPCEHENKVTKFVKKVGNKSKEYELLKRVLIKIF